MEKESSPEACSGQIKNWADEYERLFGRQNSNVKLLASEQIPQKEIKDYIDDYKKWFESIPERDDTIKKVSTLKRVVELWQLNVDVINKMIKCMESTLAVFVVMAICGCQSGLYKVSTSEDGKKIDGSVRYYEITSDSFLKECGRSADGLLYDEDRMPIRVVEGQSSMEPDKPGWSGVLWMFSLGIFPMCQSECMKQAVTVKSPIGERSGTYRVDAKRWSGWVPLFIGYPDVADERDSDARLPNQRLEGIGKDRLVKNLIGEFSYKDYVAFAKSKNGERKAEIARIKVASEKVDDLLAKNQFDDAITMIANESKPCSASLECDQKSWAGMRDRVTRAHQEFDKKHIQTLIASGRYEDAISFCDSKNSLSGENNDTLKNEALITAVKELKDAKRLIALLKQIKDIGMRDDIVIKLKNLNGSSCMTVGIRSRHNLI